MASSEVNESGGVGFDGKEFQISTNGCCLICLKVAKTLNEECRPSSRSISVILRHLNISIAEVFTTAGISTSVSVAEILPLLEKRAVRVELCWECAEVSGQISEDFELLERLRTELSYGLEKVRRKILESTGNGRRVQEYKEKSQRDTKTELFGDAVEKLRERLEAKCCIVLGELQSQRFIEDLPSSRTETSKLLTDVKTHTRIRNDFGHVSNSDKGEATNDVNEVRKIPKKPARRRCDICFKVCRTATGLALHKQAFHGMKKKVRSDNFDNCNSSKEKFKCTFPKCKRSFLFMDSLNCHKALQHPKWSETKVIVGTRKSRRTEERLQKEPKLNREIRPGTTTTTPLHKKFLDLQQNDFNCELCPKKVFASHGGLKRHIDIMHLSQKVYPCTFPGCTAFFNFRRIMLKHRKCHEQVNAVVKLPNCQRGNTKVSQCGPQQSKHLLHQSRSVPVPCPMPSYPATFSRNKQEMLKHRKRHKKLNASVEFPNPQRDTTQTFPSVILNSTLIAEAPATSSFYSSSSTRSISTLDDDAANEPDFSSNVKCEQELEEEQKSEFILPD